MMLCALDATVWRGFLYFKYAITKKFESFWTCMYRKILNILCTVNITNKEVLKRMNKVTNSLHQQHQKTLTPGKYHKK